MKTCRLLVFQFFLVILATVNSMSLWADVSLPPIYKSYDLVLSGNKIYMDSTKFGFVNNDQDSSSFPVTWVLFADKLCASCLCLNLEFPEDRNPQKRMDLLREQVGSKRMAYYFEVVLTRDLKGQPYFGISMIEQVNSKNETQKKSLLKKFGVSDWKSLLNQSELNLDTLLSEPVNKALLAAHEPPKKVFKPLKFATSNTKMNVMYRGVWSPIDVAIPGVAAEQTHLEVDGAVVKGTSGNFEVWIASERPKETAAKVFQIDGRDTVLIGTHRYRIKNIPRPRASFMGQKGSCTMKLSKLKAGRFVSARLEDFLYDVRFRVLSYECEFIRSGERKTLQNEGPGFSSEIRDQIQLVQTGDTLEIRNIIAFHEGSRRKYVLEPIRITVE